MRRVFYVWPSLKDGVIGDILPEHEYNSAGPECKAESFKAVEMQDGDTLVSASWIKKHIAHFYSEKALANILSKAEVTTYEIDETIANQDPQDKNRGVHPPTKKRVRTVSLSNKGRSRAL
jgi:SOS response regulatory protein OraA/RecX